MTTNRPLRVFLCHSNNDKPAVRELYQKLRAEAWIQPWLDEEELYPGQDWNMEIEKAIEATDAILVCLSKNSITKEGYVQREIRIALDYADYKPEGTLFIIPIRLEECTPPKRLARWQYADYFQGQRERGLQRLLVSLKRRSELSSSNQDFYKNRFTDFEELGLFPPISQSISSYVYGDKYEDSFEIITSSGAYLGEYGVDIIDSLTEEIPQKAIAFQVWLFDKNDITTATKILISSYFINNQNISSSLQKSGELVEIVAEPPTQLLLETATLQLLVTVFNFEHSKGGFISKPYLTRCTIELAVWQRKQ